MRRPDRTRAVSVQTTSAQATSVQTTSAQATSVQATSVQATSVQATAIQQKFSLLVTWLILLLLALLCQGARAQDLLEGLGEHPRLLFTLQDQARIEDLAQRDPLLAELIEVVIRYAEEALDEPVFAYRFDGPDDPQQDPRLKDERRAAMFRVLNLSLSYRLTGDMRYAEQAKADLLAGAAFPNWYPLHFLNIGEITALMAIGYDWLYDTLTPQERATIRKAIVEHGLTEGLRAYQLGARWRNSRDNWNQVCNAGLVLGALAVADEEPGIATSILQSALSSLWYSLSAYKPDGAWFEGPTYWAYGATYNALLMASLQSALGDLHGLDSEDGYAEFGLSGNYHIQTIGPTNRYFNHGDAKDTAYFSPVLFYLAQAFDQPLYAYFERWLLERDLPRMHAGELMQDDTLDRFLALLVVWYDERGDDLSDADLPLDAHFRGDAAVGVMRGSWTDDQATYLAFKGGYNQAEHGHMDIGSFVLDALGERWAVDLGGDDYDLPGYFDFGRRRWDYYRLNNHGHNTLVFGDNIQHPTARVELDTLMSTPERSHAVLDLSAAYPEDAGRVERGFALLEQERVLVQDRITDLAHDQPIRWGMITPAEVNVMGREAHLTQGDKTLRAEILLPEGATFELHDTQPANPQEDPDEGTAMLAVMLDGEVGANAELVVLFTPLREGTEELPPPSFRPLAKEEVHD